MFKRLLSIIFVLALLINNVAALEADVFVQSTVNRASKLLSDNISKDEKIEKLKLIAKETVDIEGIGFYTLGSVRKDLSDHQKKEYAVKFEEYFLKSFSSRLAEYTNPEIDVFNKEVLNANGCNVLVLFCGFSRTHRKLYSQYGLPRHQQRYSPTLLELDAGISPLHAHQKCLELT